MSRMGDWLGRRGGRDRSGPADEAAAARPYSWGGHRDPSEAERAMIREAAETALFGDEPHEPWRRDYRQMARGTLAALDWLERRRDTAPSSGRTARPEDVFPHPNGWTPTGFSLERGDSEDWGSGWVRPPTEDLHYHGAVWALLEWWMHPGRPGGIAIDVPGLPGDTSDDPDPFVL